MAVFHKDIQITDWYGEKVISYEEDKSMSAPKTNDNMMETDIRDADEEDEDDVSSVNEMKLELSVESGSNQLQPVVNRKTEIIEEDECYNQFNYWREPLPSIDLGNDDSCIKNNKSNNSKGRVKGGHLKKSKILNTNIEQDIELVVSSKLTFDGSIINFYPM